MSLSDDEQRILAQIEQNLYQDDPGLAEQVKSSDVYRHEKRNIKWAIPLAIFGLVVVVLALLTKLLVLGVIGFMVTVWAALTIAQGVGRVGRAAQEQLQEHVESWSLRQMFSDRDQHGPYEDA